MRQVGRCETVTEGLDKQPVRRRKRRRRRDRQTDRDRDRQTDRQTQTQRDRELERETQFSETNRLDPTQTSETETEAGKGSECKRWKGSNTGWNDKHKCGRVISPTKSPKEPSST